MIDKKKSIALVGAPGCGSRYIARGLKQRTGMDVIPVRQLAMLPSKADLDKAQRYIKLTIDNLQTDIVDYKRRLGNYLASGDAIVITRQKLQESVSALARNQNNLANLQSTIALRNKFPHVKNMVELGYDKDIAKDLEEKFGPSGKIFYDKQFEVELVKNIYENVDGAYIIDYGPTAPACLEELNEDMVYAMDRSRFVIWNFDNSGFVRENLSKEATQQLFEGFDNVINLQLPQDYNSTRYQAYVHPYTDNLIKDGGYEQIATANIDTTGLFVENVSGIVMGMERQVEYNRTKESIVCGKIMHHANITQTTPVVQ